MARATESGASTKAADLPGRYPGVSVADELRKEQDRIPPGLLEEFNDFIGGRTEIPVERYIDREYYDREMDRMWNRTWQWAARIEQVPEVGDYVVYELGHISLVIVRSGADEIRAFHNACLHRGRTLCDQDGHAAILRCPFHGFAWSLDGTLRNVPEQWDFPHVDAEQFCLPEAQVAVWEGFVFVNLADAPEPLDEYLGELPDHLAAWDFAHRVPVIHLAKRIRANWKVALEAFLENMHTFATHSQVLPCIAESNMQYDAAEDRGQWGRMIGLFGVPSPHLRSENVSEQQVLDALEVMLFERLELPEGRTARSYAAEVVRQRLAEGTGRSFDTVTDSELLDLIAYHVFPNTVLFGGFGGVAFRFRPWGDDPEECIWEFIVLAPVAPGGPRPAAASMQILGLDTNWTDIEGLHPLTAKFLQQDLDNIPQVQRGLHATRKRTIVLSNYMESLIRHFHHRLDVYLEA
jgi:phenylpropionate dioxygenase-like ring-hydroxylating dioxygenase large terminal subunit